MTFGAPNGRIKQRGISVVLVLFLLAVVSVMALSLVKISGTQHMSSLYSYVGAQSYFSARAGLEWAAARTTATGACASGALTAAGHSVSVACAASGPFNEGDPGNPYNVYQLTATASDGSFQAPNVSNRRVSATVKSP